MKALIQRVSSSSVSVDDKNIGTIANGLLIFVGVYFDDSIDEFFKLCLGDRNLILPSNKL